MPNRDCDYGRNRDRDGAERDYDAQSDHDMAVRAVERELAAGDRQEHEVAEASTWPTYFDRFDIVEAYALLAHDYGLYSVFDRITYGSIRATIPLLSWDRLTENGKAIYARATARAERTGKWDRRMMNETEDRYREGT